MTPFKPNITKSIDNLNILDRDLHLVYGDELETNIDNMLNNNIDNKTGSNLTYNNTVDSGKLDFDIIGNCEQDGTPTPDAPIPVKTVTGDNNVVIQNKNLLIIRERSANLGITSTLNNDGSMTTQGTATASGNAFITPTINSEIKAGDYTLSISSPINKRIRFYVTYQDNTTQTSFINIGETSTRLTLTKDVKSYNLVVVVNNGDIVNFTVIYQLEKGSTATNCVAHKSQTYTIHLSNLELAEIGDNRDEIDVENKKIIKKIGKVVLNGSETWSTSLNTFRVGKSYIDNMEALDTNLISNQYTFVNVETLEIGQAHIGAANIIFKFDDGTMSVNDFKTWLASNNLIIYYLLPEPVETPITDTTLIADLNSLYNDAVTYEGQTNIITVPDTDNAQMILDVSLFVTEKEV